jgi:hypothetical protein
MNWFEVYRVFQKFLYNVIRNVTVWCVIRKCLHLKAYKLSIDQGVERWIVFSLISLNVFLTLATTVMFGKPL